MPMKSANEILSERGVKPSYQRIRIYDYLVCMKNHPTAETIFNELHSELPTLSKTTVYNTLHLFCRKGIVQSIEIEENEVRFDADISRHGHFKCNQCGCVYDFSIQDISYTELDGFLINSQKVFFYGLCGDCRG